MSEVPEAVLAAGKAIIRVGEGRGFVVKGWSSRLVVTAAHCLPHLPPCHGMSYLEERTHGRLLGTLGDEPTIATECLFADPVADLAVLAEPDAEELQREAKKYGKLTRSCRRLVIRSSEPDASAWVFSLDGQWRPCRAKHIGGPMWLEEASGLIQSGMSGSPIVDDNGAAIGVVCLSERAPNPRLVHHLPVGLLRQMTRPRPKPVLPPHIAAKLAAAS